MNDKAIELIESLAVKLGTTAEYLWAVLVRQAYVNATYSLVWFVLALAYLIGFAVLVLAILKIERKRKAKIEETRNSYHYYEWNEGNVFLIIACSVVALFALIAVMALPSTIITGFMNPEYWALQKILEQI